MLIQRTVLERIARGEVGVLLRRWRRPTVRTGGTLRTAAGMLDIVAVEQIDESALSDADARRAGHADRNEALAALDGREGSLYRVTVAVGGPDPRVELRERDDLGDDEIAEIDRRLARLDRSSRGGSWTGETLAIIQRNPAVRAGDLAHELGRDRAAFKTDVRKLKALGLTISLGTGYMLSPRGEAFVAARQRGGSTS